MTQTSLHDIDLDPALRHHDGERVVRTEEELAAERAADQEAVATLYAGIPGDNSILIERTLVGPDREDLGSTIAGRRETAASEVVGTLQGFGLDRVVHDDNVDAIQTLAAKGLDRFDSGTASLEPDKADVERRVFGEDLKNDVDGNLTEGTGLDTIDQREVSRAAMASEFMVKIVDEHDMSALEHLPPQSGILVASRIQRLTERYGSADRVPTEELALIGRYLERVDAVSSTSGSEAFVTYDQETGEPIERSVDDVVIEAMDGNLDVFEREGIKISDEDRHAIERINDSFEMAYPDKSGIEAHARQVRERILRVIEAQTH